MAVCVSSNFFQITTPLTVSIKLIHQTQPKINYLKLDILTSMRGLHQKKVVLSSSGSWHVHLYNWAPILSQLVTMCGCLEYLSQLIWASTAMCPLSVRRPSTGYDSFDEFADHSTTNRQCKGVRCPPIFSLSNLIAGYNYNVLIYISPLIAGTNRKAYLLHASFALKDSCCRWSSMVLLRSVSWCLNITYLWLLE